MQVGLASHRDEGSKHMIHGNESSCGPRKLQQFSVQGCRETKCVRGEVHVWRVELDCAERDITALTAMLSPTEGQRASRFRSVQLRQRWSVAHGALRSILARYAGTEPASLRFGAGSNGKPELRPPIQNISFSLSHTGSLAMLAVASGERVGVDAELIRPGIEVEELSRRFFSRAEADEILALPRESRLEAFFACWTRKEAILKAIGVGLSEGLDVYECAISPELLERKIEDAERRLEERYFLLVSTDEYRSHIRDLNLFEFSFESELGMYRTKETPGVRKYLEARAIPFEWLSEAGYDEVDRERKEQLEAVKRWFFNDWRRIEPKLRTSIIEGISVFLSLFDDNPAVKRTFCPPPECYDPKANVDHGFGTPLPSFAWLIENGKVCALNFPVAMNPGLARALGVMMKLDFERAVINRIPQIESHPERYFRQTFLLCDEYQHFVTVGENEPTGDEKFFSLSRQPRCIPIIATQSISSLKSSVSGEAWRTLLQTFRTKIFLTLSDDFSAKTASELCGREDQLKVSYNLSESGHDAKISLLTGKAISHRANLSASKSYYPHNDFRFDMRTFTELKNAQAVVIAYDGFNPMPPAFCYLKPAYNDPNLTYFEQLAKGQL